MNLDNVTVELRPRSEWEAADLGARMIRRDATTIYAAWFTITLPLFVLAVLMILYTDYPAWALFVFWWFEPLTDGPILHVISRRLFGEHAGIKGTIRETFRLAWRNIIFLVPPYRFHFARSIATPVTQLEGLRGKARRTRASVLNNRIMNYGTGVTVAYQHLFLALYLGAVLIVFAFVPVEYQDTLGMDWFDNFMNESASTAYILQLSLFYFAQTLLHPWFVGAGFGLYINCRTQLEAWDIEVAFRRMVQKRQAGVAGLTNLAVVLLTVALIANPVFAQDDEYVEDNFVDNGFAGYWEDQDVDPAVERVFDSDALSTRTEKMVWQEKNKAEPDSDRDSSDLTLGWLEELGRILSFIFEFWLWIIVAFLGFLIYRTRDIWLPFLQASHMPKKSAQRVMLSSGEITQATLPDDIPGAVRKLWGAGQKRDALSLLFRGSVFYVVTQHGVRLPPSATEGDCVSAVNRHSGPALSSYFEKVVMTWVWCAYGSREPADDALSALCADWPKHYGKTQ